MAEVTNERIYAVLQKVQEDLAATRHDVREIKTELQSVRMNAVSMQQDLMNIYSILGRHETRLDRIEHRLELREAEPA